MTRLSGDRRVGGVLRELQKKLDRARATREGAATLRGWNVELEWAQALSERLEEEADQYIDPEALASDDEWGG